MMPSDLTVVPKTDPLKLYRYREGIYAVAATAHLAFFAWLARDPSDAASICAHFRIMVPHCASLTHEKHMHCYVCSNL